MTTSVGVAISPLLAAVVVHAAVVVLLSGAAASLAAAAAVRAVMAMTEANDGLPLYGN